MLHLLNRIKAPSKERKVKLALVVLYVGDSEDGKQISITPAAACLKSVENFASSREGSVIIKAGLCKLNSP